MKIFRKSFNLSVWRKKLMFFKAKVCSFCRYFAKLCGASGFWEVVLDSFSCFYIEISYSNITFCGAYTLSFLAFQTIRWVMFSHELTSLLKCQPVEVMCQSTTSTDMTSSSPLSLRTMSVRWAQGHARDTYRWYRPDSALNPLLPSAESVKFTIKRRTGRKQNYLWSMFRPMARCGVLKCPTSPVHSGESRTCDPFPEGWHFSDEFPFVVNVFHPCQVPVVLRHPVTTDVLIMRIWVSLKTYTFEIWIKQPGK